jgi:hypothetical protein
MVEVYGLDVPSDLIKRIPPNFRRATGTCKLLSQAVGVQSNFNFRGQLAPLTKSYGSGAGVVGSWKSDMGYHASPLACGGSGGFPASRTNKHSLNAV